MRDEKAARELAAKTTAKPYIRQKINVETPEEAKEREKNNLPAPTTVVSSEDDEAKLQALLDELKAKCGKDMKVEAIEFEKDDAENFHIDYIHACA